MMPITKETSATIGMNFTPASSIRIMAALIPIGFPRKGLTTVQCRVSRKKTGEAGYVPQKVYCPAAR